MTDDLRDRIATAASAELRSSRVGNARFEQLISSAMAASISDAVLAEIERTHVLMPRDLCTEAEELLQTYGRKSWQGGELLERIAGMLSRDTIAAGSSPRDGG